MDLEVFGLRFWGPVSWGPGSQISGPRILGPGVPVLESWSPGFCFLILDYALIILQTNLFTEVTGNIMIILCKKRQYKGLSKKSYSVDVNAIKNSSSKH